MSEKQFLVVIETQRVKSYLFASPILRETRGASMLLDRLNRVDTAELVQKYGGNIVYLGGGSGRILFADTEVANNFAQAVRQRYRTKTTNARVSVEVLERRPNETFPAWVARGVRESQQNKLARTEAVLLIAGRWIRPCTSCGLDVAEYNSEPDIQGPHFLCRACWQKREQVKNFYREVKRNRHVRIPLHKYELKTQWPHFVLQNLVLAIETQYGTRVQVTLPQDLEQIADQSHPNNYIGFIYADGNRMGKTVKRIGKCFSDDQSAQQAYTAFSHIVDEATRKAAVQAVLDANLSLPDLTLRNEPARFIPAEYVLAGGDDLMMVIPAQLALPIAAHFIRLFQCYTKELQETWVKQGQLQKPFEKDGVTMSAGVVLAHTSYPMSQLADHAAELMKLAKKKAADLALAAEHAKSGGPCKVEGTLDFMVLHDAGTDRIKTRRKVEYSRSEMGRSIHLTERPYSATKMLALLKRIHALKEADVPRTKVKALYAALFQDSVMQVQFDALRIRERLTPTKEIKEPLKTILDELNRFPFRDNSDGSWSTPLSEIIEIYDFVPKVLPPFVREERCGS